MSRLRLVIALGVCLATGPGSVHLADGAAGSDEVYSRAAEAMKRGDYAMAYCQWRPLAEDGDPEAQYALGWMYHHGYGLAIDDRKAASWWKRAVEKGHLEAMFSLGALYSIGSESVERDYAAAMHLWGQAAAEGHKDAEFALRQLAGRDIPEVTEAVKELLAENPEVFGAPREVKVKRANIRSGPGKNHKIIAVMERGKPLVEFLQRGNWIKVGIGKPPRVGWIYGTLIAEPKKLAAE